MDAREYRQLAKGARQAIVERDAAEYRSAARHLPQPVDFGLSESDIERITAQANRLLTAALYVGGLVLLSLASWATYSWLSPVESLATWIAVAGTALFVAGIAGVTVFFALAVLSLLLTPLLRRLFPHYIAVSDYRDAVVSFHTWERRTHRAHWLALSPTAFEREVAALYERLGYSVTLTPRSGDKGIDVIINRDGTTTIVQCKAHDRPVGPAVARELMGTLALHGGSKAIIASRSGFTAGIRDLVSTGVPIALVDLNALLTLHREALEGRPVGRAV